MLTHIDLFSGIGGFALAASWAGFETRAFCEIDPFCQKVLRKNFGDVPCFGDIRTVTAESLWERGVERVDLLTGGFPCQPFSVAGKQNGKADDRYLWPEMRRVIHETRPTWVVGENVTGILDMALDTILFELEAEGYEVEAVIIPACAVNAPHRRDRVWILAHASMYPSNGIRPDGADRSHTSNNGIHSPTRRSDLFGSYADVADPCRSGLEKRQGSAGERPHAPASRGDGWSTQSPFCGVADGLPGELDFIEGVMREQRSGAKSKPEADRIIWTLLRAMWGERKTAKASHVLYGDRLHGLVPSVPYRDSRQGWFMGAWNQEDEGLCSMWEAFYSSSFQEAQNLQPALLKRIRETERQQAVATGSRVDRLKGLGNAIVPQVAYEILKPIADSLLTGGAA